MHASTLLWTITFKRQTKCFPAFRSHIPSAAHFKKAIPMHVAPWICSITFNHLSVFFIIIIIFIRFICSSLIFYSNFASIPISFFFIVQRSWAISVYCWESSLPSLLASLSLSPKSSLSKKYLPQKWMSTLSTSALRFVLLPLVRMLVCFMGGFPLRFSGVGTMIYLPCTVWLIGIHYRYVSKIQLLPLHSFRVMRMTLLNLVRLGNRKTGSTHAQFLPW